MPGRRVVLIAAAAALVCFGGGWLAAEAFSSPAQRAAAARPPAAGPVIERVVAGELADRVVTRGTVGTRHVDAVRPSAPADRAVVTSVLVDASTPVEAGDALVTMNGRPLFVLPGTFRLYRDLTSGDTGPDVAQLQDGLRAAGHGIPASESGRFGARTARAVLALYRGAGFDVPTRTVPADPATPEAHASSAPVVPMAEVAVVPRLPAGIGSLPAVGAEIDADRPVATLNAGSTVARATVTTAAAARLSPGMAAELVAVDQSTVPAVVGTIDTGGTEPVVLIEPTEIVPAHWFGTEVLIRIAVTVLADQALLVPTVAVTTAPDGLASVQRQAVDGTFTRTVVRERGRLGGRSAIEPVPPGSLAEGDLVRVG